MGICSNVSKCKLLEQFILDNDDLREIWFSRYCSLNRGKRCEYKKLMEHSDRFTIKSV